MLAGGLVRIFFANKRKKKVYRSLSNLLAGRHFRARSHVPSRQYKSAFFPSRLSFSNANGFLDANASFRNFPGGNLQRCGQRILADIVDRRHTGSVEGRVIRYPRCWPSTCGAFRDVGSGERARRRKRGWEPVVSYV